MPSPSSAGAQRCPDSSPPPGAPATLSARSARHPSLELCSHDLPGSSEPHRTWILRMHMAEGARAAGCLRWDMPRGPAACCKRVPGGRLAQPQPSRWQITSGSLEPGLRKLWPWVGVTRLARESGDALGGTLSLTGLLLTSHSVSSSSAGYVVWAPGYSQLPEAQASRSTQRKQATHR